MYAIFSYTFDAKGLTADTKRTLIRSNTACTAAPLQDGAAIRFGKERAYCWLHYEK